MAFELEQEAGRKKEFSYMEILTRTMQESV